MEINKIMILIGSFGALFVIVALFVIGFVYFLIGSWSVSINAIRMWGHVKHSDKSISDVFILLNPNNAILFPSKLDDLGLEYRKKIIKGLKYLGFSIASLIACFAISKLVGVSW